MLSRQPARVALFGLVNILGRGRGGGVSPPRGRLGSMPKVDSIPVEILDCELGVKAEWLRLIEKLESGGGRLPEVVLGL